MLCGATLSRVPRGVVFEQKAPRCVVVMEEGKVEVRRHQKSKRLSFLFAEVACLKIASYRDRCKLTATQAAANEGSGRKAIKKLKKRQKIRGRSLSSLHFHEHVSVF